MSDSVVPPLTDFLPAYRQELQERAQKMRDTFQAAVQTDPALARRQEAYGRKLGLPGGVDRDPAFIQRFAREEALQSAAESSATAAITARYRDYSFVKVAHDDLDAVRKVDGAFGWLAANWESGRLQTERGYIGARMAAGMDDMADRLRLTDIDRILEQQVDNEGIVGWLGHATEMLGQMSTTLPVSVAAGAATATPGLIAGPGAPLASGLGFGSGFFTAMGVQSAAIEGGSAYLDYIAAGYAPEDAAKAAAGVGIVNGALETVGMKYAAGPAGKLLAKVVGKKGSAALAKKTAGSAWGEFVKDYAASIAGETGTEMLQEVSAIAGEELLRAYTRPELMSKMSTERGRTEVYGRILGVAEKTAKSMVLLGLPGPAGNFYVDSRRADAAAHQEAFMRSLADGSAASKLRADDPATFRSMVEDAATEGKVETLYIDRGAFRQLLQQIEPEDVQTRTATDTLAEKMPAVAAQLEGTGSGDVTVPTADFATHLAGTPLGEAMQEHLRVQKDALSTAEVAEFAPLIKQQAAKARELLKGATEEAQELRRQVSEVYQDVQRSIRATRRLPDEQARLNARLYTNFVTVQAQDAGMSPLDFHKAHGLKVGEGQGALQQILPVDWLGEEFSSVRYSPGMKLTYGDFKVGDQQYRVKIAPVPSAIVKKDKTLFGVKAAIGHRSIAEIRFANITEGGERAYAITGTGNALQVFRNAAGLIANYLHRAPGDAFFLTAAEPSRIRLYRRMLSEVSKHLDFAVYEQPGGRFAIVRGDADVGESLGKRVKSDDSLRQDGVDASDFWSTSAESFGMKELAPDTIIRLAGAASEREFKSIVERLGESGGGWGAFAQQAKRWLTTQYRTDEVLDELILGRHPEALKTAAERAGLPDLEVAALESGSRVETIQGLYRFASHLDKIDPKEGEPERARLTVLTEALQHIGGFDPLLSPDGTRARFSTGGESGALRQDGDRGSFDPESLTVNLTDNADASTFLHELGHYFLTVYERLSASENASEKVKADFAVLLDWFGVDEATWRAMSLDEKRVHHEKFAYSFENYLYDGKAPNAAMHGMFRRFRDWLTRTYRELTRRPDNAFRAATGQQLPVLSDEVRAVMDRMVAAEDAIKAASAVYGALPLFQTEAAFVDMGGTAEEYQRYQIAVRDRDEEAIEELTQKMLRNLEWFGGARSRVLKKLQVQHKEAREKMRPGVTEDIRRQPIYTVRSFLEKGEIFDEESGKWVRIESDQPLKLDRAAVHALLGIEPTLKMGGTKRRGKSLAGYLRSIGGISHASWNSTFPGERGKEFRPTGVVRGKKGGGMTWEQAAQAAREEGYGPQGLEYGEDDYSWFIEGMSDADSIYSFNDAAALASEEPDTAAPPTTAQLKRELRREIAADDERAQARRELLKPLRGLLDDKGQSPDMVAEVFGFESGEALVRQLMEMAPLADAVEAELGRRMLVEHGDRWTPESMELAVDHALHGDLRARIVATELRMAAGATQPVRVMLAAAKLAATQAIDNAKVHELGPRQFTVAEQRSARAALAAHAKGDAARVMVEKREQVRYFHLAKASEAAAQEVADAKESFRKFAKSDAKLAGKRDLALINAGRAVLAAFGLGGTQAQQQAIRERSDEFLRQLQAYDAPRFDDIRALIDTMQAGAKDYGDLTFAEFRLLRDTADALWHQSLRSRQVMVDGQAVDRDTARNELRSSIADRVAKVPPRSKDAAPDKKAVRIRGVHSLLALGRRMESALDSLDGPGGPGPWTKYLWRPIQTAINNYRADRNKYVTEFVRLFDGLGKLPREKIVLARSGASFNGMAELLGALVHTGNKSNKSKLLIGREWTDVANAFDEDGNLNSAAWDADIADLERRGILTKKHWDFVQAVWDLAEQMKPMAQQAHMDLYGRFFDEVKAEGFVKTFNGEATEYRGGYFPAVLSEFENADARAYRSMEELESEARNMFPATGKGFTMRRVEQYAKPLSVDLRKFARHIDQVARFSHIQPALRDAMRVMGDPALKDDIQAIDPSFLDGVWTPWLNRVAQQRNDSSGMSQYVDRFWRGVRNRTGMSVMFANLSNAMQQITGWFPALLKVKGSHLRGALWRYMRSFNIETRTNELTDTVASKSKFMNDRLKSQVFDMKTALDDLIDSPNTIQKLQAKTQRNAYFLQAAFQNVVDVTTWTGAYDQAVAEGQSETEAVHRADAAVRLTQGGTAPEQMSRFEAGTPFVRTFTQFQGFFNMLGNLNAVEMRKIARDMGLPPGVKTARLFTTFMLGFAAPMLVADAIAKSLGEGWDDGDDDGYDELADWFFGGLARGTLAMIPMGSALSTIALNSWNDKPYDDRIMSSPTGAAIEAATIGTSRAIAAALDPDKELTGKNVRDVMTLLTLVLGIPVATLAKPFAYQMDVSSGKIDPTGTADYVRGLVTGRASAASR